MHLYCALEHELTELGVALDMLKWAYAMYLSRAMRVPAPTGKQHSHCAAMVPVGDMANHNSSSPAHWRLHTRVVKQQGGAGGAKKRRLFDDEDAGSAAESAAPIAAPAVVQEVQLMLGVSVPAGGAVTIPYGRKGGDTLLLNFGFMDTTPGVTSVHIQAILCMGTAGGTALELAPLTLLPEDCVPREGPSTPLLTDRPVERGTAEPNELIVALLQDMLHSCAAPSQAPCRSSQQVCHRATQPGDAMLSTGVLQLSMLHGAAHVTAAFILAAALPFIRQCFAGGEGAAATLPPASLPIVRTVQFLEAQAPGCAAAASSTPACMLHLVATFDGSPGDEVVQWRSEEENAWAAACTSALAQAVTQLRLLQKQEDSTTAEAIGRMLGSPPSGQLAAPERARFVHLAQAWAQERSKALAATAEAIEQGCAL